MFGPKNIRCRVSTFVARLRPWPSPISLLTTGSVPLSTIPLLGPCSAQTETPAHARLTISADFILGPR